MKKESSSMNRRDFLAQSTLTAVGLGLGLPRATVAAPDPTKRALPGAKIVRAMIFPAIGISRVGNSKEYFLAPEVPGQPPEPDGGSFKDCGGKMKKQVQRFRVYGFDAEDRVVREIGSGPEDSITWTVHVANSKGAWYEFNSPMDMGSDAPGLTGQMRNQFIKNKDRKQLIIDPGPKSIKGDSDSTISMRGNFWKPPYQVNVKLGELRIDDDKDHKGRLLVFPGDGAGASATPDNPIASFSDNDGWYDDWCDGPVHATVTLADGIELKAESAWVTCCGPNYAPEIAPFITLYDVVRDVMVHGKRGPKRLLPHLPANLSFLEEIFPLFHRLGLMEWVASTSQLRQGWIDVKSFLSVEYMEKLADPSEKNRPFRQHVFDQFRNPEEEKIEQYKLPYMLGSGANYDFSPAHWFLMPKLQYEILEKWVRGEFVADYNRPETLITKLEEIALEHQPDALTRAALEPCSGGAFHPGVEMTWPTRQEAIYSNKYPFRIALGNRDSLLQNDVVGRLMTPAAAFQLDEALNGDPATKSGEAYTFKPGPNAPIGPQMPGDMTRWMGLPWFGDGFSCALAVEYANDFPNAIWWPALTPIDILPEAYFDQLHAKDLSDEEKLRFYENRVPFVRGVRGIGLHAEASYIDGLARAVVLWSGFGMVVKKKRPEGLSENLKKIIPEELFVEVDRGSMDLFTDEPPNLGRHSRQHSRRRSGPDS